MRRNFAQIKAFLEYEFPELQGRITGDNYPAPPVIELLLKLLSGVQLVGLVLSLFGEQAFSFVGIRQTPAWYNTVQKNAIQLGILVFLILPQLLSKWLITGAFELYLDGDKQNPIYSKIQTGRMPEVDDLVTGLVKAGLERRVASATE